MNNLGVMQLAPVAAMIATSIGLNLAAAAYSQMAAGLRTSRPQSWVSSQVFRANGTTVRVRGASQKL